MSDQSSISGAAATPGPSQNAAGELRPMIALALPLVLSQLAIVAIGTTDIVMMGWLGPVKLAGGALGHNLFFPLFLFGLGVLTAVSPLASQAIGAGDHRGARRAVRQGFWVAVVIGVPFCWLTWQAEAILLFLGQEAGTSQLAEGYLRAALWGLIPAFWVVVLRCFVSALSRPRAVLVVTLLGVGVNALGNYALMFGNFGFPRLELVGAGISSAIVHSFMFAALLGYVLWDREFKRYDLLVRFWRPDWPRFWEIFKVGTPIGLTILAESALFASAALLVGLFGTDPLAAHAIALQCLAVAFMIPLGISQAATVRVGLAVGAKNWPAVPRAGWSALGLGLICMFIATALFWFAGTFLVDLFLDLDLPENQAVLPLAVSFLAIAAIFQIADGSQVILAGALRGLKDTRAPLVFALIGYWVIAFPVAWLLGFELGYEGRGIWIGMAVGLAVVALLQLWRFRQQIGLLPKEAG